MKTDLRIRKIKTASGAVAVQVVRYEGKGCKIIKHIGSGHDDTQVDVLIAAAQNYIAAHCQQPDLFSADQKAPPVLPLEQAQLLRVTHQFARESLHRCAQWCRLVDVPELYIDLALMRIIEPTSKRRTLELLQRYFDVSYSERNLYRLLPQLLDYQKHVENAAINTAQHDLQESFGLVLYDVTTLYFESFQDYDLQTPGFSKDNKPQQPQIVIGLLTTRSGFPVMHEVFEGNTFEGHTMLGVVQRFQLRFGGTKPVIIADAAMLSQTNMAQLDAEGYRYIVGARLANMSSEFIQQLNAALPREDNANKRLNCSGKNYSIVCEFSLKRFKKDKREFDKQLLRAQALIARNEPGKRAKFVKKSERNAKAYVLNDALKTKTDILLGIKGYATNISQEELSNTDVINYYHDLWHIEQAFRMSKSDLKARPIFHRTQEAIRAHVLLCFMALMMGKYLEMKTGLSLRHIRDQLWNVHEAHIRNRLTGDIHVLRTELNAKGSNKLLELLKKPH